MSRSWRDLVELLGEGVALRLASEFGGEQFCVPRIADPAHRLAAAIGDARLYGRITREWGGCKIYVPTEASVRRVARNSRISMRRAEGSTTSRIAREEGLSVRQVCNILARERQREKCE